MRGAARAAFTDATVRGTHLAQAVHQQAQLLLPLRQLPACDMGEAGILGRGPVPRRPARQCPTHYSRPE